MLFRRIIPHWNILETRSNLCTLTDDELFTAALSQRLVTVWLRRGLGVSYGEMSLDEGIIDQVKPISVRIRSEDGSKTYFLRDNVKYRLKEITYGGGLFN